MNSRDTIQSFWNIFFIVLFNAYMIQVLKKKNEVNGIKHKFLETNTLLNHHVYLINRRDTSVVNNAKYNVP